MNNTNNKDNTVKTENIDTTNVPSTVKKKFLPSMRVSEEEWKMVLALKAHPHYTNLSQYFRNCLKHLYDSKFNKPSKTTKPTITPATSSNTNSTAYTNSTTTPNGT